MSTNKSSDVINLGTLLSACVDAATQAGQIIRKVWKSGELNIVLKGKNDPFTDADIKSQQLIMGTLRKHFGEDLAMIGEEDCEIPESNLSLNLNLVDLNKVPQEFREVSKSDICIFIDPLDATKEFTDGNLNAVITLVGIGYKGKAVAGVMFQPFVETEEEPNGRTMWGMVGLGLHGIEVKDRNDNRFVIATTRSHSSEPIERAVQMLKPDEVLKVGGAGYKVLLVLDGTIDSYVFPTPGTKLWDTCAPEALLRTVGGKITDKAGKDFVYTKTAPTHNTNGLIATLRNHDKVIDSLKGL